MTIGSSVWTSHVADRDIDALRETEAGIAAECRGHEPSAFSEVLRRLSGAMEPGARRSRAVDVARGLGVSVRTLRRRLARSGLTFTVAVQGRRLSVAARLLAETSVKVIDIALVVGYADHAHFTRAFRKWTGVTPVVYRRTIRQNRAQPTTSAYPAQVESRVSDAVDDSTGSRPLAARRHI